MISFTDCKKLIEENIPYLKTLPTTRYTLDGHPDLILEIAKPNSFDNYMDVVARLTLINDGEILLDGLITYNTDFENLCAKLKKKIETIRITKKEVERDEHTA